VCIYHRGACTWTLQTQYTNKQKGDPTVVFEVIASHTTTFLHLLDIFFMDGQYSVLPFDVKDKHGKSIAIYGFYYICDGGDPMFKYLVCPFKWL
jgi:hypothetical protein